MKTFFDIPFNEWVGVGLCATAVLFGFGLYIFFFKRKPREDGAEEVTIEEQLREIKDELSRLRAAIEGRQVVPADRDQGIVVDDFLRERDAYLRMENKLRQEYLGQWAGIYQGELVAVNPDKQALIKEIRSKKGNVRAFLRKITKEQPVIRLPTSRRVFDT